MRQFYSVGVSDVTSPVVVHFEKPIRKILCNVLSDFVAFSVGKEKQDSKMLFLGARQCCVVDFQSANTGKGVQDLTFWRYSGTGVARICISVVEYGSDGDNAFFE